MYSGVFPIAPTTFDEDGALDLESQTRAVDFLIDAGSTASASWPTTPRGSL